MNFKESEDREVSQGVFVIHVSYETRSTRIIEISGSSSKEGYIITINSAISRIDCIKFIKIF